MAKMTQDEIVRKARGIIAGIGVSVKEAIDALAYCRADKLPHIEDVDVPPMPPVKSPKDTIKLKSCPFCGGEAAKAIGRRRKGEMGKPMKEVDWPYIECLNCAAMAEPDMWNERTSS